MALVSIACARCGVECLKYSGSVNRSRRIGAPLYCGRKCAGVARRRYKSDATKKAEKRAYDKSRRTGPLREKILAEKREYHKRTYDPKAAAIYRQTRMPYHIEYCRSPEYREKKRAYDHVYNAKRDYGPLWEIALLTQDIRAAVLARQSDYEVRLAKGTLSKSQKRKRLYEQNRRTGPHGEVPQVGPLVNLERGERR